VVAGISGVDTLDPSKLGFRKLEVADLPLMHRWQNMDFVNKWWNDAGSYEEIAAKYEPRIHGSEPTHSHCILYDGEPIGFIQNYIIRDYPDYDRCIAEDERAAGLDLFIGEPDYIYKGLGPHILRKFLREVIFTDESVVSCIIGPAPENLPAIRAYEKTGFKYLKTIQVPDEPVPEYLMRITREDLEWA
jgi:RimJ/RimL family protein N-acetyltransferase